MQVSLTKINRATDGSTDVTFVSDVGGADAKWGGAYPVTSRSYLVELSLNEDLIWGQNIVPDEFCSHSIEQEGSKIVIKGMLEMYDLYDDGTVTIRVGDAIIVEETTGSPPQAGSHICVCVDKNNLVLYDYEV